MSIKQQLYKDFEIFYDEYFDESKEQIIRQKQLEKDSLEDITKYLFTGGYFTDEDILEILEIDDISELITDNNSDNYDEDLIEEYNDFKNGYFSNVDNIELLNILKVYIENISVHQRYKVITVLSSYRFNNLFYIEDLECNEYNHKDNKLKLLILILRNETSKVPYYDQSCKIRLRRYELDDDIINNKYYSLDYYI